MKTKTQNLLLVAIALGLYLFIYWPILHGKPIWDDYAYWFYHPFNQPQFEWYYIWRFFTWPLSVSIQKLVSSWWGKNYLYYHVFNLLIHLINTYLLYIVLKKIKISYAKWVCLLFLIHPANVISVAWMIQNKTTICALFCLLSVLFLFKGTEAKKWFFVSWLFFIAAIITKASALVLPPVLFYLMWSRLKIKELIWMIPFVLISGWGAYRLMSSSVTKNALENLMGSKPDSKSSSASKDIIYKREEFIPPKPKVTEKVPEIIGELKDPPEIQFDFSQELAIDDRGAEEDPMKWLRLKSLYHYFWQSFVPINLVPVKAFLGKNKTIIVWSHVGLLIVLLIAFWKSPLLAPLVGAHVMLLPFIGLMPAPYMNVTIVSDQHLYLVLPFFLVFLLGLLSKLKLHSSWIPIFMIAIFFTYKAREISPIWRSERYFYQAVLLYDQRNVPLAYNYCLALLQEGELEMAYEIGDRFYRMARQDIKIRGDRYYPYLFQLFIQMKTMSRSPE
jgi:hypothetical protein